MSRIESVALGGFYRTPPHLISLIATKIKGMPQGKFAYLDPCAGEGDAVLDLIDAVHPNTQQNVSLLSIELETTRHKTLAENIGVRSKAWKDRQDALQGDAFSATWKFGDGVSVLWLNPPYDFDPVYGRLEQKFLERFTPTLMQGGALFFVVPHYALEASAEYLAKEYAAVYCYRFPQADYDAYKQVVLLGIKREGSLLEPDPEMMSQISGWSSNPETITTLEDTGYVHILPCPNYLNALSSWRMSSLDFPSLLANISPWSMSDRRGTKVQVPGIVPEGSLENLLTRKYPLAMPPRAAHIAAGIAAGIFNGSEIRPDQEDTGLPNLLVKGVFDKEFKTVEERTNKDGDVTGEIQIQQPKLVTTVLDLTTNKYTTIKSSTDLSGSPSVETMTMADLLHHYGRGLMEVMLKQCPVMHDPSRPEDAIPLPELKRPLYRAQREAAIAAIKLLGGLDAKPYERKAKCAFVLGEIGAGKTGVSLAVAEALKMKRVLVMCPPHLLTSWQEQIQLVTPWFRTFILSDIEDVQKLAALKDDVPTIAIMSREAAKLGHSYEAVTRCGKCGTEASLAVDHAKKRSTCGFASYEPTTKLGRAIQTFALELVRVYPTSLELTQAFSKANIRKVFPIWAAKRAKGSGYEANMWAKCQPSFEKVVRLLAASSNLWERKMLEAFLTANPVPSLILEIAEKLYARGVSVVEGYYGDRDDFQYARRMMLLTPPSAEMSKLVEKFKEMDAKRLESAPEYLRNDTEWPTWETTQAGLWLDKPASYAWLYTDIQVDSQDRTKRWAQKRIIGDRTSLLASTLAAIQGTFKPGTVCGEPLYQAVPEPRRYPLATYIARKNPKLFGMFIADEAHELSNDTSAQSRSCSRIVGLGIPTLLLTGSVMGGYAKSIFTNTWNASPDFRNEFDRDDESRFVDRFGYRKRLVEDRDKETSKVVEYGSMSDRVQRSERMIGEAPGILPLFLLRYLLPLSVTLHKVDLALDIPPLTESVSKVTADATLMKRYQNLQDRLIDQIKKDRFEPERAGKLWGAMAQLPSFLDLATQDVGNNDSGRYEIRYPESIGGGLVASEELLPASTVLPKEQWLIDQVLAKLALGRNVLVLGWHTKLLDRLSRLLEQATGGKCPVLHPSKVPTQKRQTWIEKEIIKKGRRVLISNPVSVSTGLNNLIYFADEVFMENPCCSAIIYRQTVGRIDRIGQRNPTEVMFPLYTDSAQEELHSLLLHKVAVSMSVDGLDGDSALQAAGVGEVDGFSSFSVGKQLYDLLTRNNSLAA